ncbi:MAG: glycosyltransferase family 39 protein [Chloroflexi bacterium]|nr:glycosyltransferase family 39 protein [Chloroflexota bacterium]
MIRKLARGDLAVAAAIVTIFGALYLLLPSRRFFPDGMRYALLIEAGDLQALPNPNHLLYNLWGLAAHRLLNIVRPGERAFYSLSAMDGLFGVAGLAIFYRLARDADANRREAVLASVGLGSSFGYWTHSSNAEVYVPALFFLLAALWVIFKAMRARDLDLWFWSALLTAMAILTHQMHVLFLPALALAAVWASEGRMRRLFLVLGSTGSVVTIGYAAVAWSIGIRTPTTLFFWIQGLGASSSQFITARLVNLVGDVWALVRSLVGDEPLRRLMTGVWTPRDMAFVLSSLLALCLVALLTLRGINAASVMSRSEFGFAVVLATMFIVYAGFFTFWAVGEYGFWVQQLVPVWVAVLLGMQKWPRWGSALSAVLVLNLLVTNGFGTIAPRSRLSSNENYVYANWVADHTDPAGVIILPGNPAALNDGILLRYWWARETFPLRQALSDPARVEKRVDQALTADRSVYLATDKKIISTQGFLSGLRTYLDDPVVQEFLAGYHLEEVANTSAIPYYGASTVWRLSPLGR